MQGSEVGACLAHFGYRVGSWMFPVGDGVQDK